jgi:hypothetical protein
MTNKFTTGTGQKLVALHSDRDCVRPCPFHGPSNHHMVAWPMHMRTDAFAYGLIERLCAHGIGHPDPDSIKYLNEYGHDGAKGSWGVHGCDGCCSNA